MALSKYRLGELLKLSEDKNDYLGYDVNDVKGISIKKTFIETKADMTNVSLAPYFLVKPDYFAYVTVTSRNGEKITLAHNDTDKTYIVSSSYVVFYVNHPELLNSDYLFMYFNRPEFDRYARFNSWGSARETFTWDDMCDIELQLPPLEVQQKYVDIYNAMLENQRCYERGLDDLKLVCDAYLDKLRHTHSMKALGEYIELVEDGNEDLLYGTDAVRGISIDKKFIDTKADMTGVSLKPYYIVQPNAFAYVTVTSRNSEKISLAINDTDRTCICSSSYVVFRCKNEDILLPQYLMLVFSREEFNRYARFHSWGSARENFTFDDMCNVEIPIPDISVQRSIANIYNVYTQRKQINERLKAQIKEICPILIKGAIDEAGT